MEGVVPDPTDRSEDAPKAVDFGVRQPARLGRQQLAGDALLTDLAANEV